jgi:hypothetical protein
MLTKDNPSKSNGLRQSTQIQRQTTTTSLNGYSKFESCDQLGHSKDEGTDM